MKFALINRSELIRELQGDMGAMAVAAEKLINEQFAPAWGLLPVTCTFYEDAAHVPSGAHIFTWVDDDKDVPGALGYHSQAGNEPYSILMSRVILEEVGGGVLDVARAGVSCSSVFGHEALELLINPNVTDWVSMPDGRFLAKEVCDPVQDGIVLVTLDDGIVVAMSDGVFPEYFDSQAPLGGDYSLNGFGVPLGCSLGGYQIFFDPRYVNGDGISAEFGPNMPSWLRQHKMLGGRSRRRMDPTWKPKR